MDRDGLLRRARLPSEVGEGRLFEDGNGRVPNVFPDRAQRPRHEVGAVVGIPARGVADRRELPLEQPDDALECDLFCWPIEPVAAVWPTHRADDSSVPKHRHHLFQDGAGGIGRGCDLVQPERTSSRNG
jgi:hypothetical protein